MTRYFRHLRNTLLAASLSTSSLALAQDARMSADPALYSAPPSSSSFAELAQFIDQDLRNERDMLNARRNDLLRWDADAQAAFRAAFGTDDPGARRQVLACIDRELDLNSRLTARNFQPAPVSEPGRYAYVDHDDPSTIYLDQLYGSAPAVGPDSRAGTLVHEMSHFDNTCATQDIAYGQGNAAALANEYAHGRSAVEPWRNADNVEYYVEDALGRRAAANSPTAPQRRIPGQVAQAPARAASRTNEGGACDGSCDRVPMAPLGHTHAGGHATTEYTGDEGQPSAIQRTLEQPAAPNSPSTPIESGSAAPGERLGFDESIARRTNTETGNNAGRTESSPRTGGQQMTDEQFRAYMADTMRQFQQTAQEQRRELQNRQPVTQANNDAVASTDLGGQTSQAGRQQSAFGGSAPPSGYPARQGRASTSDGNSRPAGAANGRYDADGYYASRPGTPASVRQNRAYSGDGSSRPIGAGNGRYDANGNYVGRRGNAAPVRQNRVYMGDGTSRPIGASASAASAFRAFQQQANNQITAQQRGRGNSMPGYSNGNSGGSSNSGETNSGGQSSSARSDATSSSSANASTGGSGTPAPSARLTYDDDAPRQSASSQAAMPVGSAVTPRQSGSASQTAGIVSLN